MRETSHVLRSKEQHSLRSGLFVRKCGGYLLHEFLGVPFAAKGSIYDAKVAFA